MRRLVFLSTVKVNGESTVPGQAFSEADVPDPRDPYGVSKAEAEVGLRQLSAETGLEVTILRPPLVYGAGVKGNLRTLMRWVERGVPLPLGAVKNRRSMVGLGNLSDAISAAIDHPAAANRTFMVSDGEDLSTSELLRRLSRLMGKPSRLLPVPQGVMQGALRVLGRGDLATRLLGDLRVESGLIRRELAWAPRFSVEEGLGEMVGAYRRVRAVGQSILALLRSRIAGLACLSAIGLKAFFAQIGPLDRFVPLGRSEAPHPPFGHLLPEGAKGLPRVGAL